MTLQLPIVILLVLLVTIASAARDASNGEFPFEVSIKSLNNEHLCGGIIVTSKWVLTSSDCAKTFQRVRVGYDSTDTESMPNQILSKRIEVQRDIPLISNALALIELEEEIVFGRTVKSVRLPRSNVNLVNGTISGWKANPLLIHQWTLKVIDMNENTYVTRDCRTQTGNPVSLTIDQYCLILDAAEHTSLASLGAVITRRDVSLGFYPQKKLTPLSPIIFVDLSHHGQWIEGTLQEDSKNIKWANAVPNSSEEKSALNFFVIGVSFLLYYLISYL